MYYYLEQCNSGLPPYCQTPNLVVCDIIRGSINFGEHYLHQGDFEVFPEGLDHGEMHSELGSTFLLRSDIPQDLSWI